MTSFILPYNPNPMDLTSILKQLKQQHDALKTAIFALEGRKRPNGRRRIIQRKPKAAKPRRRLSAIARKRISEAAKARWRKAKKAGRNKL
jgi:hypothetical protein